MPYNFILSFTAGLGTGNKQKPLIINDNSSASVVSGSLVGNYPVIVKEIKDGKEDILVREELHTKSENLKMFSAYIGEL